LPSAKAVDGSTTAMRSLRRSLLHDAVVTAVTVVTGRKVYSVPKAARHRAHFRRSVPCSRSTTAPERPEATTRVIVRRFETITFELYG
jgi:hypothetical protein